MITGDKMNLFFSNKLKLTISLFYLLLFFPIPAFSQEDNLKYPPGAPEIISDYGSWYNTIGEKRDNIHEAIDIFEEVGYPIIAAAPGKVVRADDRGKWGLRIIIYHGKNDKGEPVRTVYLHNAKNLVRKGDEVKRGQKIAELGKCPACHTAHLHFAVYVGPKNNTRPENPHDYWVDGPNQITCFSETTAYSNKLKFTYPVVCK
jgi:murein DD-endopeptidase MepM/ murein hydrolase activator NlpD